MGVFAAALGRYVGYATLDDLEQFLLDAFARDISCDRTVHALLAGDLVHLVDVDNATLCSMNVPVRGLDQPEEYVFDVLSNVAGLGEGGCVADSEGDVEGLGQCFSEEGLAAAGGADEENV